MSIGNAPASSTPPDEPIIGTPADTFEPKFQAFMSWFLNTIPSEWAAKVAWLQSAFNSIGSELDDRAAAKFDELDQLDNEGVIRSVAEIVRAERYPHNALKHSGRFVDLTNNPTISASSNSGMENNFDASELFDSYNGSVVDLESTFFTNNSTNGGTSSALDQTVIDLLSAQGITANSTQAKLGVPFNIAKVTAGAGVSSSRIGLDNVERYRMTDSPVTECAPNAVFSIWVRTLSGSIEVLGNALNDDSLTISTYYIIEPSDGWVRLTRRIGTSTGYTGTLVVRGLAGNEVLLALPYLNLLGDDHTHTNGRIITTGAYK